MKLIKAILVIVLLYVAMVATAQTADNTRPASLNKTDGQGKRNGLWAISQPERMGEEPFTEVGSYDHGNKYGAWYKLDEQGELLANETFRNNVLDGEAKYFERGFLVATGNYRGLNPAHEMDTFMVENPITGEQSLKSIPTERRTVRHGLWRFYDAGTGRLLREEDYQVDEMIYQKEFPMSKEDSAYYKKRIAKLPHNSKSNYYKPPVGKQTTYYKQ
ncbi:MAG: hypothetical protein EOP51_02740 [Sphingobacteriales bacterium]|nr:MAG: hypothetical protein EOP51_02740 [Sphingobacteriales bacterium]